MDGLPVPMDGGIIVAGPAHETLCSSIPTCHMFWMVMFLLNLVVAFDVKIPALRRFRPQLLEMDVMTGSVWFAALVRLSC